MGHMTYKDFLTNLDQGKYGTLVGANRAIGRASDLSEAEKEKAKAKAAEAFGEAYEPSGKKSAVAKGALTKKKAGRPPSVQAEKSYGPGKGRMKKAPKRSPKTAEPKPQRNPRATEEPGGCCENLSLEELKNNPVMLCSVAETIARSVGQAAMDLKEAAKAFPKADVSKEFQACSALLGNTARVVHKCVISPLVGGDDQQNEEPTEDENEEENKQETVDITSPPYEDGMIPTSDDDDDEEDEEDDSNDDDDDEDDDDEEDDD